MRVMVLDSDLRNALQFQSVFGAEVERVQVMRHQARGDAKQLFQIGQRLLKEEQRFVILQVADMLAQAGVPPQASSSGTVRPKSSVCGA